MQVKDFKKTLFPEACESLKGISAIVPRYRAVHVKVNVLVFGFMKSLAPLSPINYFRGRLVSIWVFDSLLLIQG